MIIGVDLALIHGAVVDETGRVLYQYDGRLGTLSTPNDLWQTALDCADHTPHGSIVVCDFDREMANWGEVRARSGVIAMLMTMLISFYAAQVMLKGCEVHFVNPALVRTCLGLHRSASKKEVHGSMTVELAQFTDKHGDCADAWLLAYTWQCAKEKTQ